MFAFLKIILGNYNIASHKARQAKSGGVLPNISYLLLINWLVTEVSQSNCFLTEAFIATTVRLQFHSLLEQCNRLPKALHLNKNDRLTVNVNRCT
jgi:hypothetical protein